MKISIAGKGGSGKTTISGTLARLIGRTGMTVIAVDGDSNPNLALTLGLDKGSFDLINPVPHGLMRHEKTNGDVRLSLSTSVSQLLAEYGVGCPDNVRLLVLGMPGGAGTGWMCSNHATVRGLLHELPAEDGVVVVDTEASPEHLSRATTEAVDVMLVVAEPYFKSLETARRYSGLGKDLGIPKVAIVANKVRNDADVAAIEDFCNTHDMELFGVVPYDEELGAAERAGEAPIDHAPQSPSIAALHGFLDMMDDGGEGHGQAPRT